MAHRVTQQEGPERTLHGHEWEARVTFCRPDDSIDHKTGSALPAEANRSVGEWIEEQLHGNTILQESDGALRNALEADALGRDPFLMPEPPTVENVARLILRAANRRVRPWGVWCREVEVSEGTGLRDSRRARVSVADREAAEAL